jgi:hypothetical protein
MEESLQYAYFRPYGKNYKLNSSAVPCLLESLKVDNVTMLDYLRDSKGLYHLEVPEQEEQSEILHQSRHQEKPHLK